MAGPKRIPSAANSSTIVLSSLSSWQSLRRVRKCGTNVRRVRRSGRCRSQRHGWNSGDLVDLAGHRGFGRRRGA